jgi:hypothetical protein
MKGDKILSEISLKYTQLMLTIFAYSRAGYDRFNIF